MIIVQWLVNWSILVGGAFIFSLLPAWIITHTFMIHRLDRAILRKDLKGTFDDNLWMINSRTGSYAGLLVLHKKKFYRKFLNLGNKSKSRLKKVIFYPKSLSNNFLDYEGGLKNLTIWQRLFLYWIFWGLILGFGLVFLGIFLNWVCGLPPIS